MGCFLWLSGDGLQADGTGACSGWQDFSGQGNNLIQTQPAEEPMIVDSNLHDVNGYDDSTCFFNGSGWGAGTGMQAAHAVSVSIVNGLTYFMVTQSIPDFYGRYIELSACWFWNGGISGFGGIPNPVVPSSLSWLSYLNVDVLQVYQKQDGSIKTLFGSADTNTSGSQDTVANKWVTPTAGVAQESTPYTYDGKYCWMFTLLVNPAGTQSYAWSNGSTYLDANGNPQDMPNGSMYLSTDSTTPGTTAKSYATIANKPSWLPGDTSYPALVVGGDCDPYFGQYSGGQGSILGNIDEMLIFNRPLSTSERNTVETYISQKYNLATSDFPAGLAGAGQL
jgi:hypothetical protein